MKRSPVVRLYGQPRPEGRPGRCRVCGQSAGWTPCTTCGLPNRNQLIVFGRLPGLHVEASYPGRELRERLGGRADALVPDPFVVLGRNGEEQRADSIALALHVAPRTVKRDWAFARAWPYEALGGCKGL